MGRSSRLAADIVPRQSLGNLSTDRAVNILLVEDDAVDVETVRRAFKRGNILNPLWVASNVLEALDNLRNGIIPPQRRLVLLDLNMPLMNGIEFLREVRTDPALASTSVVVLTTSNEERDRVEAYHLNVAGYLLKPVTFDSFSDLMVAINRYWTLVEFA